MITSFEDDFNRLDRWGEALQTALEAAGAPTGSSWWVEPGQVDLGWPRDVLIPINGTSEASLTIDNNGTVLVWMSGAPDAQFHISEAPKVAAEQWPLWSAGFHTPSD